MITYGGQFRQKLKKNFLFKYTSLLGRPDATSLHLIRITLTTKCINYQK